MSNSEADAPNQAEGRDPDRRDPGPGSRQDRDQEREHREDAPGAAAIPAPAEEEQGGPPRRLTPRQARRLRVVLSSVGMAAMAVVLALRIASRSSVLVVGVYGLALILCGVVIELSRNGRTRLGSWLLGIGLVAAVGADRLLIP
ncbi:hypothetical protein CP967_01955 [Streptomyces nitrosporeus]|uniref:Uncharacterized protein n=1 Tax=Streptomyces nitrosporeus TaxID=28894 RepID=A0A5J6F403_9ACTN|nr:cytochrome d ubiquinol oxidase subunit II [Streptomyces nitrosporeus]QEU70882.1 hypothetical protein CP967_01955 [Streptomyces nitrosporeus]GGZ21072.1 hypothetical protein GCM10010327_60110 [Streptomyces nitrosporeus]